MISPLRLIAVAVAASALAIMIMTVLVPIIGDDSDAWSYDDYREIPEATDASGALEIVQIGGVSYVHARDVGAGSYSIGIKTVDVTVDRAVLDIYLMNGQSNAAYYDADPSKVDPAPKPGTVYYYGSADRPADSLDFSTKGCAMHDMVSSDGTPAIGDKGPVFGARYHELTGHKVYYVTAAIGGKGIEAFQPEDGEMWVHTKAILVAAMAELDASKWEIVDRAYLWIQGEANWQMTADRYKTRFLAMHDAILDGDLGYTFDKCIICLPQTLKGDGGPREAQIELAQERPGTIIIGCDATEGFTTANGLLGSDGIHYSQLGDNIVGVDLADAAVKSYGLYEATGPVKTLMSIIPLLLIVGIIIAVVAEVVINRAG